MIEDYFVIIGLGQHVFNFQELLLATGFLFHFVFSKLKQDAIWTADCLPKAQELRKLPHWPLEVPLFKITLFIPNVPHSLPTPRILSLPLWEL